jgi:UDP-N-acetylglucosamine/UDP-N-acetylgalactosamine 4-epimerase
MPPAVLAMGIVSRCRKSKRRSETLFPYAVSKYVNELYASVFSRCYALETIGLCNFNVFGPRQDPKGTYSAVIPKWIAAMIQNEIVFVNGDGETSRDFCYIENVTQVNVFAATTSIPTAVNQVYNVGVNARISLNRLVVLLQESLKPFYPHLQSLKPLAPFGQEMSAIQKPTSARPRASSYSSGRCWNSFWGEEHTR